MDAVAAGRLRRCRDHLLRPRLPAVAPASSSSSSSSATATPARRLAAGRTELTLTQDVACVPTARRVLLHVPPGGLEPVRRYPLLFCLHGNGGVPDKFFEQGSPLGRLVEAGECVGVAPVSERRAHCSRAPAPLSLNA